MNLKTLTVSLTLLASVLALTGCSYTRPLEKNAEQANEFTQKQALYNKKRSLALNIYNQMDLPPNFRCEDKWLSDEDYKEFYKKQGTSETVMNGTAMQGAVTLGQAVLLPTSFSASTGAVGMGSFLLVGGLLFGSSGHEPIYPHWLIYVPTSKAKTPEEAWKYVVDAFDDAFIKWEKSAGVTLTSKKKEMASDNEQRENLVEHFLTDKSGKCPIIDEKYIKEHKFRNFVPGGSCVLTFSGWSRPINEVKTTIPSWLPNGGQEAWKISVADTRFKDFARPPKESKFFKKGVEHHYDQTRAPFLQKDITVDLIKNLPENFYAYVPATITEDKEHRFPPFVVSKKGIYWFIYPKEVDVNK